MKIFAIFEMNTLATVYCCLGGVKMCMAAVEGGKKSKCVFREKPGKHFLQIIQVMVFEKLEPVKGLTRINHLAFPNRLR